MNTPKRSQEERREATRDVIVSSAMSLVAERGVEATTMADLAERAGLSKGAITHHFDSKDVIIDAVLERAGALIEQAITAAWDPTAAPFPRLRKAIAAMISLPEERPTELRALLVLSAQATWDSRLGPRARARIEAFERVFCEGFSLTLAELHAHARIDPEVLGRALVASVLGASLRTDGAPSSADTAAARRFWESAIVAAIDPFMVEAP